MVMCDCGVIEKVPSKTLQRMMNTVLCLIFVLGVGSMILTRELYRQQVPEDFIGTEPTISKAATVPPGQWALAGGFGVSGVLIVIGWSFAYGYNARHISRLTNSAQRVRRAFNRLTLLLGAIEGVSVFIVGTVTMDINLDLHIAASYTTFFGGAFAFLSDSFGVARWRSDMGRNYGLLCRLRIGLSVLVMVLGLFFLYLYKFKDTDPFGDPYITRLVYTMSEIVLAGLSFAYAPLYGFEVSSCRMADLNQEKFENTVLIMDK